MAVGWSDSEIERTLDAYFEMLRLELTGRSFVKVDFYRPVASDIGRSPGAVEYKFSNVSAVLAEMGATFIEGYKPLVNVQSRLRDRVQERFAADAELRRLMIGLAERPAAPSGMVLGDPVAVPLDLVVPSTDSRRRRAGRFVDFNALESQNTQRGLAGERLVVARERRVLHHLGRPDLAERVRHVSVEDGDGLGFDVQSFDVNGAERFLEVKTTIRSERQPFYVSRNEVQLSVEEPERFTLVRVFHLERQPGFYELPGSLQASAELVPDSFIAWPRGAVSA